MESAKEMLPEERHEYAQHVKSIVRWTHPTHKLSHVVITWNKRLFVVFGGVGGLVLAMVITIVALVASRPAKLSVADMSKREKIAYYEQTYEYFTKTATKEELLIQWIKMFSGVKYKPAGDYKFGELDCIGAVNTFFRAMGSNMKMEGVQQLDSRVESLAKIGQVSIRRSWSQVRPTDILIMRVGGDNWHVGFIVDKQNGRYIKYADVNAYVQGYGVQDIVWGNDQIHKIVGTSFALWIGDLFNENSDE